MIMRTKVEIDKEIAALKKIIPGGPLAKRTQDLIDIAIEELEYGIDRTSDEWNDLPWRFQDIAEQASLWKSGHGDKMSKGFVEFFQ